MYQSVMPMDSCQKLSKLARVFSTAANSAMLLTAALVACGADSPAKPTVAGRQWQRKTIYHSPQTPGYTCWVGAWQMPDKSLMVHFKQATGPLVDRPHASAELLARLDRIGDALKKDPQRDFTGLRLANIYLRSTDGGASWQKTAEEAFPGPVDRPVFGGSHVALADGSILRAVDGSQLPLVRDLPRRIYFQRSSDLGTTWGSPEIAPEPRRPMGDYLGDYGDCITRVRRLRNGNLLATGVVRPAGPIPGSASKQKESGLALVMLSSDEGQTWQPQNIELTADQHGPGIWNEWDCAELPSGELLGVFRRRDPAQPTKQVRWQGVLRRNGDRWQLDDYRPAPLEHSGHPELLSAREGVVLHIATTGTHWTSDGGQSWQPLVFADQKNAYRSRYYPRSLQNDDGQILIFSHLGGDNAYGQTDQAMVMDTFRLTVD
jgi:hypothetical protein